jgi:hypothetical protein
MRLRREPERKFIGENLLEGFLESLIIFMSMAVEHFSMAVMAGVNESRRGLLGSYDMYHSRKSIVLCRN